MARRYSLEVNQAFQCYTVHHQNCIHLSRDELTPLTRLMDIGMHKDDRAALLKARQVFPKPWGCEYCCCYSAAPLEHARAVG